jgi:hypothetical protein
MNHKTLLALLITGFAFGATGLIVVAKIVATNNQVQGVPVSNPIIQAEDKSSQSTTTKTASSGGNEVQPSPSVSPSQTPNPTPPPPPPAATPHPSPSPTPAPAPTPPPPPPPSSPSCGSAGGSCTAAQVAEHNSASDCWVIYNSKYYNVTSFVQIHPGGVTVFTSSTCGHDITSYLAGQSSSAGLHHKHSATAFSTINSYYVGPVSG